MVKKLPVVRENRVQSLDWEDSLGEGNGTPLHYSCLENSMDRVALMGYSPWDHKESDLTEGLTLSLFMGKKKSNVRRDAKCPIKHFQISVAENTVA